MKTSAKTAPKEESKIVIKKYPNRRLYNTDTSTYVTLDDLAAMVKEGVEFAVYDAKSGEEITRQILTQIIYELELKGQNMLPVNFLRSLIGFYDDKMKDLLPHYLEASMAGFIKNQAKMQEYARESLGFSPFTQFEEIGKQNMELFKKTFSMFNPFEGYRGEEETAAKSRQKKAGAKA